MDCVRALSLSEYSKIEHSELQMPNVFLYHLHVYCIVIPENHIVIDH